MFAQFGATAKGVDWGDEGELLVHYDQMLAVLDDFHPPVSTATLLDAGCGWGGLLRRIRSREIPVSYTGVDVVEDMVDQARREFPNDEFLTGDVAALSAADRTWDYVVCNGILTQKHDVSDADFEVFARGLVRRLFSLCTHGLAFNMMSTRVNFKVDNLFYQEPSELLHWLVTQVSPRVRLDHSISSLASGRGKHYDFTAFVYKG